MFKKLLKWLNKSPMQSDVEAFIASKNPKSAAEVDYWLRYYDANRPGNSYSWGRGL